MLWLGYIARPAVRLDDARERVSPARSIAISSTTIIAKAFDEQRIDGRLPELVFGVLIVEDLIAIFLLAVLTAVSTGAGRLGGERSRRRSAGSPRSWSALLVSACWSCRASMRVGRAARPPRDDARRERRPLLRGRAARAAFGYSVALGAFLAGSLVAESGEEKRRSSTWCSRCATCSRRSSSSRSAC